MSVHSKGAIRRIGDRLLSFFGKKKKRLGLALGGGAARGIAHVGVLKALHEAGIKIDMIAATSSGSLFGALYAGGMSINELVESTSRTGWHRLIRIALTRRGAVSGNVMERLVEDAVGLLKFSDLKIPLSIIASDLKSGKRVILNEGNVARAVHASSAIPGVFVPVVVGGRSLVDGMVTDNVPADVVRDMGADVVVAVDVVPRAALDDYPDNMVELVERALDVGVKVTSNFVTKDADILIEPVDRNFRPMSLNHAVELIEMGERAAKAAIPKIKKALSSRS